MLFFVLRSYENGYRFVTVHTLGDFIELPYWETSLSVPWYFTESHYPNIEPTSPCPILVMPSNWLESDKYQCLSHWFDSTSVWTSEFPDLPKLEMGALLIRPSCLVDGLISGTQAFNSEGRSFRTWPSDLPMTYQIYTCFYPAWHSALVGYDKELVCSLSR